MYIIAIAWGVNITSSQHQMVQKLYLRLHVPIDMYKSSCTLLHDFSANLLTHAFLKLSPKICPVKTLLKLTTIYPNNIVLLCLIIWTKRGHLVFYGYCSMCQLRSGA